LFAKIDNKEKREIELQSTSIYNINKKIFIRINIRYISQILLEITIQIAKNIYKLINFNLI